MDPAKIEKKKEEMSDPVDSSQSASTHGTKRSAEEGEKEKTVETIPEKRVKRAKKTSFMDLPDEVHTNIFNYLDLPSQLRLRLNKRLDRLQYTAKNSARRILFNIGSRQSELTIDYQMHRRTSNYQCEKDLTRFARNTSANLIFINAETEPNEQHCRVIDALFQFEANSLIIDDGRLWPMSLPYLTLPPFLTLAQSVKSVDIKLECTSFSAQELTTIHKTMVEGCKMETLYMFVDSGMKNLFIEACFGVATEDVTEPHRGKIYRSANESLEMYHVGFGSFLYVYEGNLQTTIEYNKISFEKLSVVVKPDDKFKLKLDHLYEAEDDYDSEEEDEEEDEDDSEDDSEDDYEDD